ncbi:FAD-linked oxidoreductase sorD [Colletotrichum fructicola]|nr:FAD-linked oxidoreductase sorD [Colletotrichum fructicola]KAF4888524.1 FAD-linked oxidoreductase sorD [Colletotrichum fructicola]KAF4930198.1 FAD-linked oxidoreductase sorD [Colletotrichum fructicola]KAF5496741.1 FAD-linked oxidoreductase sorD [Colletotrichum fructicola]KAI8275518.1 FAD-linked oxidoreductase sorD [Colletotrichum sp. SAR11_57]
MFSFPVLILTALAGAGTGAASSNPPSLRECLDGSGIQDYAFPSHPLYSLLKVKRWNLDIDVTPAVVTVPETAEQIAAIVACAQERGLKVQPKSGGHSFGNYGLGGHDGAVVVDLKKFQHFSKDENTHIATIGAGTRLGDVTKKLHSHGGRAMSHGTCPSVGIGGHATIGGLGPTSRQFGSALDHVEAVTVVLADGTITRASWTENKDLFWALKGAGAGFGIITEFVVRTEPAPGNLVQYSFALHHDDRYADMADEFKAWQRMIADPALPRKLASQVVVNQLGMIVSGTYYGTQEEWESLAAEHDFFRRHNRKDEYFVLNDWLGHMAHLADEAVLLLGTGQPTPIYCKSLAFTNQTLIPDDTIDDLFKYFDDAHKGSPLWFAYFDLEGGAINDVPPDATAYAHRDALFYMQSYVIGLDWGRVSPTSKNFIRGIADTIQKGYPKGEEFGVYAGYVDPELENGQRRYWGKNLPRLEQVKLKYDPEDVFSNPQSVRPAAVKIEGMAEGRTDGASASVSHDEL